jgi:hypothetical protein
MPPQTAAPNWWVDVQEHREEIDERARRAVEWSDDDFDLVPASVGRRRAETMLTERAERVATGRFTREAQADGVAVAGMEPPRRELRVTVEEPVVAEPPLEAPAPGRLPERRTVQITGHPGSQRRGAFEIERRRPPRTVAERATHRPDRIAMWAAAFGFVLILIAAMSASPGA